MITAKIGSTSFSFKGDFSGDTRISIGGKSVDVPFEALRTFFYAYQKGRPVEWSWFFDGKPAQRGTDMRFGFHEVYFNRESGLVRIQIRDGEDGDLRFRLDLNAQQTEDLIEQLNSALDGIRGDETAGG